MTKHRDCREIDSVTRRALIAARARKNPHERFNSLLHHLTYNLVSKCLDEMSKSTSPGIDKMDVKTVQKNLDWLLPPILSKIHKGQYQPPPVKQVYIPKAKGGKRPIGIPTVLDRAIQAAIRRILEEIYEQDFVKDSFGFRPKLSCHHALATVNEVTHKWRSNYVLEVDIRDFFGSLDHGWLRRFLEHRIGDRRILRLIESWLKAGVIEEGRWQESERGSPQGGPISPLLSNIYLHYVLDLWWEKKVKRRLQGRSYLVRYCDDFCIFFENPAEMKKAMPLLQARLSEFGLKLAEEKTHQTDLNPRGRRRKDRRAMEFLGFKIFRTRNRQGTGFKTIFQIERSRYTSSKLKLKEQFHRGMHWDLKSQARSINRILVGLYNYYGVSGNSERLQSLHHYCELTWKHVLSHRSNKAFVSWESMDKILKEYPIKRPRIRYGYSQLRSLAML